MADLYPLSFPALVARLDRELALEGGPVYSLPRRDFWTPEPGLDLGIDHMAGRAATPVGPASGPHTQLAQNIVVSWLAGARFLELKTVQILDELEIPRPCIFVPNVGYNVEWSQELLVHQSAREYVAAWYLVHALMGELGPGLWPGGASDTIFDMSLGYDLEGIRSEKVVAFIRTLKDASALLEELRGEIRDRFPAWADVEVPSQVSSSTTLSTFHGCPADQIEAIASYTLEEHRLHTVIKLNPTLLGYDAVRDTLDGLGYGHVHLRREDFEKDLSWAQLMDMLPRLEAKAKALGLGFGVKLSNTLVCESQDPPFDQKEMYLSGQPLHVLAVTLADRIRKATGGRFDLSFSAGVDMQNFPACVAAGLKPVTTCSDLLKGQGYARLPRYLKNLEQQMKALEVDSVPAYIAKKAEADAGRPVDDPAGHNLSRLAEGVRSDERYAWGQNRKAPKKVGSELALLDCLTCDKCIKVCPNVALFSFDVPKGEHEAGIARWRDGALTVEEGEPLVVKQKHQIGNVVDLCNLCGQCDPWCPEDGGPYVEKPHLFLRRDAFDEQKSTPGFVLEGRGLRWRRDDGELFYEPLEGNRARLHTASGTLELEGDRAVAATGSGEVDLRAAVTLRLFLAGFTAESRDLFVDMDAATPGAPTTVPVKLKQKEPERS